MIRKFSSQVDKVIVLDELDPFIEEQVLLMGIKLYKPDGWDGGEYPHFKSIFPLVGELNSGIVRSHAIRAGLLPEEQDTQPDVGSVPSVRVELPVILTENLPKRSPALCPGCPHRSTFYVLNKLKRPINGDIGCYTLGVVPPLSAMDTCGCMGASIGVAHGGMVAGDSERHISVIGDSTFFHTGVHGANRLASTSLLEGLVWGDRTARHIRDLGPATVVDENEIPTWDISNALYDTDPTLIQGDMQTIRNLMWHYVGLVRSHYRMNRALRELHHLRTEIEGFYRKSRVTDGLIGLRNSVQAALIVANAARMNQISRGCHYREESLPN